VSPPVPETLSPLRWRWTLLVTRRDEIRFLYWPPRHPAGHRRITMFDREGYDVGTLVWMVCDGCRVGSINKISIMDPFQRLGLGRRLISRAVSDRPSFYWRTTGQSPSAKQFFPVLASELGVAFEERGKACEHVRHQANTLGTGDRPRATLDRRV
jgi:hypothetical protein